MIWSHEAGPSGAPLVVLVHGSMDRSASMVKLSRHLDTEFRVLRYDRRGYGRSKPHPGPFTIDAQVADLVDLLDGRPAVVVGHSYGGNVALAAADRHPGLVRAVLAFEAPLSWLEWWPGTSRRMGQGEAEVPPELVAERFMRRMVGDETWERLPDAVRDERLAEGETLVGEIRELVAGPPWAPDRIGVPVLVLHGSDTGRHHRAGAEHLAALVSDEPAIAIAGSRHNGPYTHPAEVASSVRSLLDRVGADLPAGESVADRSSQATRAPF